MLSNCTLEYSKKGSCKKTSIARDHPKTAAAAHSPELGVRGGRPEESLLISSSSLLSSSSLRFRFLPPDSGAATPLPPPLPPRPPSGPSLPARLVVRAGVRKITRSNVARVVDTCAVRVTLSERNPAYVVQDGQYGEFWHRVVALNR